MITIKNVLYAGALTLGIAACHHDRVVNTPANNTYGTTNGQTPGDTSHSYSPAPGGIDTTTTPDVNGTSQTGAAGTSGTAAPSDQSSPSSAPGTTRSTDNSNSPSPNSDTKSPDKTRPRQNGSYKNGQPAVPSSTTGTNTDTGSDMDRTPGTADQPDR